MNRIALLVGIAFGFLIAAARLSDYDVIHRMLLLQEFDVFLLMGSAVGTAAPLLWLLQRSGWRTAYGGPLRVQRSTVERRHLFGSAVFGLGWAVAGSCPGPAVVMTAAGNVMGVAVMAGIAAGTVLRDRSAAPAPAPAPSMEGPAPQPAAKSV